MNGQNHNTICDPTQRQLLEAPDPSAPLADDLERHLAQCEACLSLRADLVLIQELAQVEAEPELPDGFELSLRRRLRETEQAPAPEKPAARVGGNGSNILISLSLAASLLVFLAGSVLLGRWFGAPDPSPPSWHLLKLEVTASVDRPGATFQLTLPHGVRLHPEAGPGLESGGMVRWQSPLRRGLNAVELPLLLTGDSATVLARLSVGKRRYRGQVRLVAPSVSQRPAREPAGVRLAWNLDDLSRGHLDLDPLPGARREEVRP